MEQKQNKVYIASGRPNVYLHWSQQTNKLIPHQRDPKKLDFPTTSQGNLTHLDIT